MMNAQRFELAKQAILREMLDSKVHCADSIYAVKKCTGLEGFVDTLNKFMPELKNKRFPSIEIIRTYFSEEIEQLNQLGVYIDQEVRVLNQDNVWLFGHCTGTVRSDKPHFVNIVVNDDAEISIDAMRWALQKIYIKAPKDAYIKFHKSTTATQLISNLDKEIWKQSTYTTEQAG